MKLSTALFAAAVMVFATATASPVIMPRQSSLPGCYIDTHGMYDNRGYATLRAQPCATSQRLDRLNDGVTVYSLGQNGDQGCGLTYLNVRYYWGPRYDQYDDGWVDVNAVQGCNVWPGGAPPPPSPPSISTASTLQEQGNPDPDDGGADVHNNNGNNNPAPGNNVAPVNNNNNVVSVENNLAANTPDNGNVAVPSLIPGSTASLGTLV